MVSTTRAGNSTATATCATGGRRRTPPSSSGAPTRWPPSSTATRCSTTATSTGELTLGENIGDLSGIAVALKAFRSSLNGQPSPVIDGFTGDQRFFIGWAQVWRRKYRDEELLKRLVTDPHSPSEFRTNGPTSNLDAFYDAFGVKPDDRMYRAPGERVKIW